MSFHERRMAEIGRGMASRQLKQVGSKVCTGLPLSSRLHLTLSVDDCAQVMLSALLVAIGLCAAVVILSARDLQRRPSELIQVHIPPACWRFAPIALSACLSAYAPTCTMCLAARSML